MAVSFQCMTKSTTNKNKNKNKEKISSKPAAVVKSLVTDLQRFSQS